MEIRIYCCIILLNCVLFFPSLSSKSVSLNDLIAAEDRSASLQTPQSKVPESRTRLRELPKNYKILTLTKHMTSGSIAQANQKISPLRYKKTYQIRTPLRPKKIKYSHKPRSRRINTTTKREIENDEKFNRNYIPLLKSLSALFNDILRSDSGYDDDDTEYSDKHQYISSEECSCAHKSKYDAHKSKYDAHKSKYDAHIFKYDATDRKQAEETTPITTFITSTVPTKAKIINIPKTSTTAAYNTLYDNISALRRNKNVPILSSRDPISSRRNNNGFGERSISTYNGNIEGHIAGNNGSDENDNTRGETTESYTENNKQYTSGSSGDDPSCNGTCRGIGGNRSITPTTNKTSTVETINGSNETITNDRGNSNQLKGFDRFKTRGNKTESRILLSESSSRLRRFESQEETTEILWQIESPKENSFDVTYNFTRNQRLSNRDGTVAPEDQKHRRANKKLTINDLTTSIANAKQSNLPGDNQKIVVIYDGYSIARDVNGENKLTEKAYRILS